MGGWVWRGGYEVITEEKETQFKRCASLGQDKYVWVSTSERMGWGRKGTGEGWRKGEWNGNENK